MTHIHPVFNVVKLLPVLDDSIPGQWMKPPPPLEIVDGDERYVVEWILDSWLIQGWLHFQIKWEGYGYEENTWVPEGNVSAPGKIREFYWIHPGVMI